MAICRQHQTMQGVHPRTEARVENAARIAGSGTGQLRRTVNEGDRDATLRQRMGSGATGETGADDESGRNIHSG